MILLTSWTLCWTDPILPFFAPRVLLSCCWTEREYIGYTAGVWGRVKKLPSLRESPEHSEIYSSLIASVMALVPDGH